jgi:hypothetical protein
MNPIAYLQICSLQSIMQRLDNIQVQHYIVLSLLLIYPVAENSLLKSSYLFLTRLKYDSDKVYRSM